MRQILFTKLCRSFLLILFMISFIATTLVERYEYMNTKCRKMNRIDGNCECVQTFMGLNMQYVISCSGDKTNHQINVRIQYIEYEPQLAEITSNDINGNAYKLLPSMKIGNLQSLALMNYPLSNEPVAQLLDHLGVTKLKILDIQSSGDLKENITREHLSELTDLENLGLYGINLSNLSENTFADVFSLLRNLNAIHLLYCDVQILPSELFSFNRNLKKLIIRNNVALTAIRPAFFDNLGNLTLVDITCGKTVFDDLCKYGVPDEVNSAMRLSCGFASIPTDLLPNSGTLRDIFLDYNELEAVNENLFTKQINVKYISLSHNRLQSLPARLLDETKFLQKLDLSYNRLTHINGGTFDQLYYLEELNLGNNRIKKISLVTFTDLVSLRLLNMENNHMDLSDFDENKFFPFKLMKLQTLNLRNNTLRYIFNDWRYEMKELKELDLSYNNITSLSHSDLLFHSHNKVSINLSHNHIRKIDFQNITMLAKSTNVQLNDNPLDCDCNLLTFIHYLQKPHVRLSLSIDKLACDKPEHMKGLNVQNVKPKELLCSLKTHCPRDCECWKRTYDLKLGINCSNKNLKEVPVLPLVKLLKLESIVLHIENNKLYKLPRVSSTGYANVTEIYAAGNNLSQIEVHNLPKNLTYIDLSRNNFNGLSIEVLNFFNQNNLTKQMFLSGNPWNCECKNKPLLEFVTQSSAVIRDIDNINCATPIIDKMTHYFVNNKICKDEQFIPITWIVGISVSGFSIAVIVALYYKYQTEVKIWMYKYRFFSCLVNEEELDKDKKYDAFISYSHKDEQFIAEHLVRELEKGPIRFKLCIYVRDFIVGEYITDQIVNAIDVSRRTIIVLSENFINSAWARMEFRLAHKSALNDGHARIIVIIFGQIGDIKKLDKDLQAYLKMNIYLEWGDPWFWEKLRYAMPHPSRKLNKRPLRRNEVENMELNAIRETEACNELS